MIAQRVSAITWAGRLPADQFDQFGVMMKLPATSGALYFCDRAEMRSWRDALGEYSRARTGLARRRKPRTGADFEWRRP